MIPRLRARVRPAIAIALAVAVAGGAALFLYEISSWEKADAHLDETVLLMRRHPQLRDFDGEMRRRGFSQTKVAPGQACGFRLDDYPPGSRCIRYSGHDIHMDFMVTPDGRVTTVVPGWD